ncbi:MAG: sugar phosphate isomerase/epimerase family protein [bacterium]
MARPITLFTGQWADLPLKELAEMAAGWGYDGLELACWGDHFEVDKALSDDSYCQSRHDILAKHGLQVWAISNHLVGQAVCDVIDERHKAILPERVWGDGKGEKVQERAAQEIIDTAKAAAQLGVPVVNGFTGSSIWPKIYAFPPTSEEDYAAGFEDFGARWKPICDAFQKADVRFGLEVHPTEIAFDIFSARKALEALDGHPAFGFNFDPSHLAWQLVDPVEFLREFPDRIYHTHMKDVHVDLAPGRAGILGSHLPFGDCNRRWDFRSLGHGVVNFPAILRTLNAVGYGGPLSVEWEDPHMAREHGAQESVEFLKSIQFPAAAGAFDQAFEK